MQGSRSLTVQDVSGTGATRSNVAAALKSSAECLIYYGHAELDYLPAQDDIAPPVIDTSNDHLLTGMIVCAVACSSANVLGPHAVKKGVRTYIGYTEIWSVVTGGPEYWFEMANNVIVFHLLHPHLHLARTALPFSYYYLDPYQLAWPSVTTCGEALMRAMDLYSQAITYYKHGPGRDHPRGFLAAAHLTWARDHLILHGDPSAMLR